MTALERLHAVAGELGSDELAVLSLVVERRRSGRQRYGDLRVAVDRRPFGVEASEEAARRLVCAVVARGRSGR